MQLAPRCCTVWQMACCSEVQVLEVERMVEPVLKRHNSLGSKALTALKVGLQPTPDSRVDLFQLQITA